MTDKAENTKRAKGKTGEGYVERLSSGRYRCTIGSKYVNDKGDAIRFRGMGDTPEEARKEAKREKTRYEKSLEDDDLLSGSTVLFYEYVLDYLEHEVKDTITQSAYRNYMEKYRLYIKKYKSIANLQVHNMNKKVFQQYYDTLTMKFARKTIEFPIQLCQRTMEWLFRRGIVKENYAAQAQPKFEVPDEHKVKTHLKIYADGSVEEIENDDDYKRVFTDEDFDKFVQAMDTPLKSEYLPVAVFLCETGLRPMEFAALLDRDVSVEKKRVKVNKALARRLTADGKSSEFYIKVTKTHETRTVPLSSLAIKAVNNMRYRVKQECKSNPDKIFYPTLRNGKYRQPSAMEVGFKKLCDDLGIDRDVHPTPGGQKVGLNLYACRHTCETMLLKAGENPLYVAQMLGHSPRTGLKHYTHLSIEDLETRNLSAYERMKKPDTTSGSNTGVLDVDGLSEEQEKALLLKLIGKHKEELIKLLKEE